MKNIKTQKKGLFFASIFVLFLGASGVYVFAQNTFPTQPNPNTFKVFANDYAGGPAVIGVKIQAKNVDGSVVKECTTPPTGACRFTYEELSRQTYFSGEKDGVLYGGRFNPNYGCKSVTVQAYDGKVYQYVDGVRGEPLQSYGIFAESFFATSCASGSQTGTSTSPQPQPTQTSSRSTFTPMPRQTSSSSSFRPRQPQLPFNPLPSFGNENEDDEDFVEDEEEIDVDVALTNVAKVRYGRKAQAKGFSMKIFAVNSAPYAVSGEFSVTCSTSPEEEGYIEFEVKTKNVRFKSGKNTFSFFYPVGRSGSEEVRALEADRRNGGTVNCIFTLSDIYQKQDRTEIEDSDPSNNEAFIIASWKNNSNLIVEEFGLGFPEEVE